MTFLRWGKTPFTVTNTDGTIRTIHVQGRDSWALECLMKAGAKCCTAIDHPGSRWSAYIHDLRHEHGLDIETIHEEHGPPFEGTHGRYVLKSAVTRTDEASA